VRFKKTLLITLITLVIVFAGCNAKNDREIKEINIKDISEIENWQPSKETKMKKLVFSLPTMDKKMCETFPRLIISTLEDTPGVIDTGFDYEGHVTIVYFDSSVITKDKIINHDSFSWIGTKFISEEKSNLNHFVVFEKRKNNNELVMPEDHMEESSTN
jgi:hypothetical protein